ncbi:hypothetical protein D3C87_1551660 [compost metagenome]
MKTGVIHHVATDLVGSVGDAVRVAIVGRHQQQARRFYAVTGQRESLGRGLVRLLFVVKPVHRSDPILFIGIYLVDHRFRQHHRTFHFSTFNMMNAVVHGADGANGLTVVVAAAGWTALPRVGTAPLWDRD